MKLGGLVTTCGEPTTGRAIDSLAPWVDAMVVVIDAANPLAVGCPPGTTAIYAPFNDDYSGPPNTGTAALAMMGCDWIVHLDADEIMYGAERVRGLIARHADADVIACPRRHFEDLHRRIERYWDYPDLQYRIRRSTVRMAGVAHPRPAGLPITVHTSLVTIEHFNLAIRSEAEWAAYNERMRRLEAVQARGH